MHIVTCGDSWSSGEWEGNANGHVVTHNGVNLYLQEDGHQIHNIHRFSNKDSISALVEYLTFNSPDIIFYFFTDPFRDLIDPLNNCSFIDFEYLAKDVNSFLNLHQKLLNKSLKKLDKLNRKIYVLGGCQRLIKQKYKNIEIIVESVSELIDENYVHPNFWDSGWSSLIKFQNLEKKFFYFIEEQHKLQWNMDKDKYAEFFRPDGLHPNRKGHLKLYNYIKENVSELK